MVSVTDEQLMGWVLGFMWPFMRISAMMIVAPVIGDQQVSVRVRLFLAVGLTVGVMPAVGDVPIINPIGVEALLVGAQQMVIGLAMGVMLGLAMQTLAIAGESAALSMGLGFATMADPVTGQSTPVVSQIVLILGTLFFISIGGHLMLIELMATSFETLPVGMEGLVEADFRRIAEWGVHMYAGAVLLALPAVVGLLTIYLSLGVMTRAAPQMNIFSVGFPITIFSGFFALMIVVIPGIPVRMPDLWQEAFRTIGIIIGAVDA